MRLSLHLLTAWPWPDDWQQLIDALDAPSEQPETTIHTADQ